MCRYDSRYGTGPLQARLRGVSMSVVMASVYITVHLFGFMTKEEEIRPYKSLADCEKSMIAYKAKFVNDPDYVVTYDPKAIALHLSNKSQHTVSTHRCSVI